MKNTFKFLMVSFVLGIYFLIGTATSREDDFLGFTIDGDIVNISDSCDIISINFLLSVTPTRTDTMPVWFTPLLAGDTAMIAIDSFGYHTVHYVCTCPSDSVMRRWEVPFAQGPTSTFPTIEIGCE